LREALAAASHDYILTEPSEARPRSKREGAVPPKRRGSRRSTQKSRRVAGFIVSALCVAALGGIAINALVLQKARHPAPLFGRTAPTRGQKAPPELAAAPAPVPAPRPHEIAPGTQAEAPASVTQDRATIAPPAAAPSVLATDTKPRDAIAQLLLGNSPEAQSAAAPAPDKTVLAAQKALVKLGFVLKPDGVMGATTRQAIERYERDHHRASNGELTPAVLRRLAAESGAQIN
jgi:Putative peptidoglycan binding domain